MQQEEQTMCSPRGKLPDSRTKTSLPISALPLIYCAAGCDINKPIKASKSVEVSWPEFPSGTLLPTLLLLLSGHQYGSTGCSRNMYPMLQQSAKQWIIITRRNNANVLISLMVKSHKGRIFVRHTNSKGKHKNAYRMPFLLCIFRFWVINSRRTDTVTSIKQRNAIN